MYVKLSHYDIFVISQALSKAAAYEIENLDYIINKPDPQKKTGMVHAVRYFVVLYMSLRRRLLHTAARRSRRKEDAETWRDVERDMEQTIMRQWAGQMRKIKEAGRRE